MSFDADLQLAQATWQREQAEADAAKTAYDALLLQRVPDGFDISAYSGIDWTKARVAGFAFFSVSDGNVRTPGLTLGVVDAAIAAGVPVGPYHFARLGNSTNLNRSGKIEAGLALSMAHDVGLDRPGCLPLAYDVEAESMMGQTPAKAARQTVDFIQTYEYLTSGRKPIIYTNPSTWTPIASAASATQLGIIGACPLWLADWTALAEVPIPWTALTFWQYQGTTNTFPGVPSADLDRCSISKSDLDALRIS